MYNLSSKTCQFPWVTEMNLTLHSFQTECVATFMLFLLVSRQTVYSLLTHPILLAIPHPYLQISQSFYLVKLPLFNSNIHTHACRQKLQGTQCNALVKTSLWDNYFAVYAELFQKQIPRRVETISDPLETRGRFSPKVNRCWTVVECQIIKMRLHGTRVVSLHAFFSTVKHSRILQLFTHTYQWGNTIIMM